MIWKFWFSKLASLTPFFLWLSWVALSHACSLVSGLLFQAVGMNLPLSRALAEADGALRGCMGSCPGRPLTFGETHMLCLDKGHDASGTLVHSLGGPCQPAYASFFPTLCAPACPALPIAPQVPSGPSCQPSLLPCSQKALTPVPCGSGPPS